MKRSEQINELAAALAKAQPAFEAAARDHKARVETKAGGSYEFNYADFRAYQEVCQKPLGENGLSFVQEATRNAEQVSVVTLLMHTSGQWIETEPLSVPLIPDSRGAITAQIIGSGTSYAKRYSLSTLLGLSSDMPDDDGNAASGNEAKITPRAKLPPCPKCQKTSSVIAGKAEHGGGIVCWKKKEGCGHTWATDAHPFSEKHGEGNVPSDQSNGVKPEKPAETPPTCKEYNALSRFLKNCGAQTPEDATQIINWAVPDVGDITGLRMMAGECQQIFDALRDSGMSGPAIYAEAVQGAPAT